MYIIGVIFFLAALASAFFLEDKINLNSMLFLYVYFPFSMLFLKKLFLVKKGYLTSKKWISIYDWFFGGMIGAFFYLCIFIFSKHGGFNL